MTARFEYKVIPAPRKGKATKGVRDPVEKFAHAVAEAINTLAEDGWEYQRAERLPAEERKGLTSKKLTEQHLLVFRRIARRDSDLAHTSEGGFFTATPPAPSAEREAAAPPVTGVLKGER